MQANEGVQKYECFPFRLQNGDDFALIDNAQRSFVINEQDIPSTKEFSVAKQLLFDDRARLKLQRGVNTLADAVAVTMGPTGRNVIIDKSFGNPIVTKDGVTVSKEVELDDPYEHMGAKLVNEVASKTSDIAGDGTTTATVLARAIYEEGLRSVSLEPILRSFVAESKRRLMLPSGSSKSSLVRFPTRRKSNRLVRFRRTTTTKSASSLPTPWNRSAVTA